MNSTDKTSGKEDIQGTLSTLWVFALFNYLYCDVLGLMDPVSLKAIFAGNVGGILITQEFLFSAAVLMEIPIAMVLLSKLLKYKMNRLANIVAGTIMTIVQISSLFFGTPPTTYYIFFSIIEISCTALIVWYAWNWPKPEDLNRLS
jgi:hypothetical protein